jgi:hypothetical protein
MGRSPSGLSSNHKETTMNSLTRNQLAKLKAQYNRVSVIDAKHQAFLYKKLSSFSDQTLIALCNARINIISLLAAEIAVNRGI